MTQLSLPTEGEVLSYAETCSNWGRWGPDDQLGTVNLVTEEKRKQAAALVRDGVSVSCAWTIKPDLPGEHMSRVLHYMTATGEAGDDATWSGDFMGLAYHGNCITHVDALCHVFTRWQDVQRPSRRPREQRKRRRSRVHNPPPQGVVTRGVLLDIARLRGRRPHRYPPPHHS